MSNLISKAKLFCISLASEDAVPSSKAKESCSHHSSEISELTEKLSGRKLSLLEEGNAPGVDDLNPRILKIASDKIADA